MVDIYCIIPSSMLLWKLIVPLLPQIWNATQYASNIGALMQDALETQDTQHASFFFIDYYFNHHKVLQYC